MGSTVNETEQRHQKLKGHHLHATRSQRTHQVSIHQPPSASTDRDQFLLCACRLQTCPDQQTVNTSRGFTPRPTRFFSCEFYLYYAGDLWPFSAEGRSSPSSCTESDGTEKRKERKGSGRRWTQREGGRPKKRRMSDCYWNRQLLSKSSYTPAG